MAALQWSESIAVGIGIIDAQHQNLFNYYNELSQAVQKNDSAGDIKEVLEQLKTYAVYHFDTEIGLMRQHGYPEADEHEEEHREYLEEIEDFDIRHTISEPGLAKDMLDFLTGWITRHIKTRDMAFAEFLKEREVS